jgi:hypothetical protein
MRRTSFSTTMYVAMVFLSGLVVGGFGMRLYTLNAVNASVNPRSPEEFRRRYVAELRATLKLTDAQVNQLQPILDETRRSHREFHDTHRPELKAIQDEQVRRIRLILTEAQQPVYTKMLEERERERQRQQTRR